RRAEGRRQGPRLAVRGGVPHPGEDGGRRPGGGRGGGGPGGASASRRRRTLHRGGGVRRRTPGHGRHGGARGAAHRGAQGGVHERHDVRRDPHLQGGHHDRLGRGGGAVWLTCRHSTRS